ncbi:MAG: pilus assembly protein, partial [Pseudomonadota bacterium]
MFFKKAVLSFAVAGYLFLAAGNASAFSPAQGPLFIGDSVPGNLVLVPSVEWPTVNSVANVLPVYTPDTEFVGYFDSDKCYEYRSTRFTPAPERHFYPIGPANGRTCSGAWSGNFMNWAATQTIDPFRKVLTGGHRVKDTATETWLEKARHDGQGATIIYPNRTLAGAALIAGATPFTADNLYMRVYGLGYRLRFRLDNSSVSGGAVFDPTRHPNPNNPSGSAYDVSVRVAVCVPGMLEDNCVQYGSNYKPEGLIQSSNTRLRFSVFGYLNDDDVLRDGAVLRSRQKFVGPQLPGGQSNGNAEWSATTGVFVQNPNPQDVMDTNTEFGLNITRSGVINYLNQFGQTTTNSHKSHDPVSELFYAAVRYMRGEVNVPEYTDLSTGDAARFADGFPVITDWFYDDEPG